MGAGNWVGSKHGIHTNPFRSGSNTTFAVRTDVVPQRQVQLTVRPVHIHKTYCTNKEPPMRTLENIILRQGNIVQHYTGVTGIALWRALNLNNVPIFKNPLYPDFEKRRLPNGKIRERDIVTHHTKFGQYVRADVSSGTSLMDMDEGFGKSPCWDYHLIPAGTVIPWGLIITQDHKFRLRDGRECFHYSISPNQTMSRVEFRSLLDTLARNASIAFRNIA